MASEAISTPKMIVPYEWILENVEEEPMTIASKMISFRGQKVFRVGLKNHAKHSILFFMAIDLNKIGMEVEDVKYGIQSNSGIGPAKMMEMTSQNIGDEGSLQLFAIQLGKVLAGNWTFAFRIAIAGTSEFYCYKLCDRLAKEQLWAALKNQRNLADVELVVKDKIFPAHKAILAARSQVFADEFHKVQPVKDGPHQIRIDDDVEPSTVENFLHFIYTGETMGTLADEELFKLAEKYGLLTLSALCRIALNKEIEAAMQMAKVMDILNSRVDVLSSSKIMPEKETEIFLDGTTPTFRCAFQGSENGQPKCLMEYQNEELFFAYITGQFGEKRINKPVIHFACAKHRRFGLKVEDIYCSTKEIIKYTNMSVYKPYGQWLKMESEKLKENAEILLRFIVQWKMDMTYGNDQHINQLTFDIKTVSTIGNYSYEMMDNAWFANLWLAALHQKMTDVDILIGTVKVMEAHRVILSARSPVLNASLNKISDTAGKSIVTFGAEFNVEIVQQFLNFLYTGRLETCARSKQLRKLATIYEVETLKNICQLINANPPDVEEVTNHLLEL